MIPIVTFTFELWPQKSIGFTIVTYKMSTKFDEEGHNGLVCIGVHSLLPYVSTLTLTYDLQNK